MNGAPIPGKRERPTWRQALVMLGGGTLLASSACYGVAQYSSNDAIALPFAGLFVAGMVLALVGVILVIVRSAKAPAVMEGGAPSPMRPAWPQVLIMLASGTVLGATSCYGFLETLGRKGDNISGAFAAGFYVGCLVAAGGLIMALIRVARRLMGKKRA
jgi:hypothetical protein